MDNSNPINTNFKFITHSYNSTMQDIIRQSNSSVYGVKKRSRSRDK